MIDYKAEAEKIAATFLGPHGHACVCDNCKHARKEGQREIESLCTRVAADVLENAAGNCQVQQIGVGQEWMAMQKSWEGKTAKEVWNQAVCHCADIVNPSLSHK